jgi:K(+)-stimulated pyrophosphate-energized sodium pump
MSLEFIPIVLGVLGLVSALLIYLAVLQYSPGEGRVREIADEIHVGAMTFMRREYSILFVFAAIVTLAIFFSDLGAPTAISFVVGALCSAGAGYIGMYTATHANVRTTVAANQKGLDSALDVAFFGGSIMGLTVAAMGLLGLGVLYLLPQNMATPDS